MPIKYKDAWLAFNGDIADGDTEKLAKILYHGGHADGAYSFVWMQNGRMLAGRDPNGFHPLYYAQGEGGYVVASETVADPSLYWKEVPPGSVLDLQDGGYYEFEKPNPTPCCFENVYFSHVASDGVWDKRRQLGKNIEIPAQTDVIVPVPESAIAAAEACAAYNQLPMVSAVVRNRYSERTFIAEGGFEAKYTIISDAIRDKKIVLVDDSIVRGHTMKTLVPLLKAFAAEVHVRVTFPQIKYPCKYGIRITGAGCYEIPEADSLQFLPTWHFSGCKACVDGVYLSKETLLPDLTRFNV
jgi:amidophosphoribosyltransferase